MEKPPHWPISLPLTNCLKCTLYKHLSYRPYNSTGNFVNPKVLIIGEAPGSAEEVTGRVFQGRAGQLMRGVLSEVGIHPDKDCLITNVVMCRPLDNTGGNRKPEKSEIAHCHENLEAILNYYRGIVKVIVPMGATPLRRLSSKGSITNARGTLFSNHYGNIIPSYHPAYILRNMNLLKTLKTDLAFVSELLKGESPQEFKGEYILVDNPGLMRWLIKRLNEVDSFVFDIESTGLEFWIHKTIGISFSWRRGTGVYLPLWVRTGGEAFPSEVIDSRFNLKPYWGELTLEVMSSLKEVFSNSASKTNHNIKFDLKHIENGFGIKIPNVVSDTMIYNYLYDENQSQGLKEICDLRYRDLRGYSEALRETIGLSKVEEGKFADAPLRMIAEYGAKDADASLRLRDDLTKELGANQIKLATHFYLPLTRIYTDAELEGIKIDIPYIERLSTELKEKLASESTAIYAIARDQFNINSPKQLINILYNKLGLPVINTTKTGTPSTDEKTLKMLGNVPIAKHILNYRGFNKNLTTYVDKMKDIADSRDKIHPSNKLTGTRTGRLSSSDPNIQNIPRDTQIKGIFIPSPGYYLVEIDYSQIELRVMAWYSNDQTMLNEYQNKIDIHASTAQSIFGIKDPKALDPKEWKRYRKLAKLCNFGCQYGGSAKKLMVSVNEKLEDDEPHLTLDMAGQFINFFFNKYKGIAQYLRIQAQIIRKDKKAVNCFGRIRHLPNVDSPDEDKRAEAIREGINAVIQSTASDCTQFSIIKSELFLREVNLTWDEYFKMQPKDLWNILSRPRVYKSRFLFSVHDAQIWEVHQDEQHLIEELKKIMLSPPPPFTMVIDTEEKIYKKRWGVA